MDEVKRVRSFQLVSQVRSGYGKQEKGKRSLSYLTDEKGSYSFRPNSYIPRGVLLVSLYSPKSGGKPKSLRARLSLPDDLKLLLAMMTPITLSLKSESGEAMVTYNSQ